MSNENLRTIGLALALTAAVVITYLPAFSAGFVWDDDANVSANAALRSVDGLIALWRDPSTMTQYYPLVYTTFWIEHAFFGLDPAPYHAVNVALHAANALLVWRILLLLGAPAPFWVAMVFALHPVQVESVAWITELKNLQSGFFYLCAARAYFGFELGRRGGNWRTSAAPIPQVDTRTALLYALALVCFVAAVLSKTVTATLPGALALAIWWKRGRLEARDLGPLLPLLLLVAPIGALTVGMEARLGTNRGFEWDPSWSARFLLAAQAAWFYAWKIVWPQAFAFVYPRLNPSGQILFSVLAPTLWACVLAALYFARDQIGRGPLVGVLYFGGTLLPALGFLEIYFFRFSDVADHWQYLACIGLVAVGVGSVAKAAERMGGIARGAALGFGVLAVGGLAFQSFAHSRVFESSETLFRDSITKNPSSPMCHYNLAVLAQGRGDTKTATHHYERTLELDANDIHALNNLAYLELSAGRVPRARALLTRAVDIAPDYVRARWNLGLAHERAGNARAAIRSYREALDIDLTRSVVHLNQSIAGFLAPAHLHLAKLLLREGRNEEAIAALERALAIDPSLVAARRGLKDLKAHRRRVRTAK